MKAIFNPAIQSFISIGLKNIENWVKYPIETQRHVLQDLISNAQHTAFGLKHNFSNIMSIRKFKEKIPLVDYDKFKPFIDKIIEGEEDITWNTPISWLAKSSGTTNDKSKFIPISEECLMDGHYKAAKDVLYLYYKNVKNSSMLLGKGLVVGGSHQLHQFNENFQCGDLSAVLLQNSPFWSTIIRTPDLSIALLDDWEEKIFKLAEATMKENVTSLVGVPTWSLILLNTILKISGAKNILEVWPQFEVFIHGGVSFLPYKHQFEELFGGNVKFMEIYNASEGFFAIQDNLEDDGLLLLLDHGIFYEFMDFEDFGKPEPKTIGLDKVVLHKNYVMIISTNTGLWRYIVGDLIQFTNVYPFRIIISGRTKQFINTFGEELMVHNTDKAIELASLDNQCMVKEYTLAPVHLTTKHSGYHKWLIEFEKPPLDLLSFTKSLDAHLKQLNSDYEAKRQHDLALAMPKILQIKNNEFHRWLKLKNKLGGQHKIPRMSSDLKLINELLELK
ncbi:MAG: GH3 auxin-responsive promoter family protein [Sediminibacterium sp.]|nr:GH3 auxin-responsive promoter family protein [Sediminibacterium sp.]